MQKQMWWVALLGAIVLAGIAGAQAISTSDTEELALQTRKTQDPKAAGVVVYQRGQTYDGPNLCLSGHAPQAELIDMDGNVLHAWQRTFEEVWPGRPFPGDPGGYTSWRRAFLYENGDLLAVFEGAGLVKLDRDSNVAWACSELAHHAVTVLENNDVCVLTRTEHIDPTINPSETILEDFVTILNPQGIPQHHTSVLEAARRSTYWPIINGLMPKEGDIFHTNTLQVLDGSLVSASPLFKKGNILTCFKTINSIGILDMDTETLVWYKVGPWVGQHQPVLLSNANILLFDNNRFCDYSRVVEFEPFTDRIVWYYLGTPPNSFFSKACGDCQPLPNGNVFMVESQNGRALEVKRDKTVVWEYYNPHMVPGGKDTNAYLYDVVRLRPDFPLGWAHCCATPPAAAFAAEPTWGRAPLRVQFMDLSDPGSQPIVDWDWNFGDGGASHDQHPAYTYQVNGAYGVSLTVTTSNGTDAAAQTPYIYVTDSVPALAWPSAAVLTGVLLLCGLRRVAA